MSRLRRAERQIHRLIRRGWFRIGLHLLVILGLIATTGAAVYADRYFNRGVAETADLSPIRDTDVNPMGINTLLNEEVDPAKIDQSLDMIAAGGFGFIRQMFPWYELEPAKDSYIDPQTGQSTWAKYDRIVNDAVARHIEIIARLDKPPRWARAGQPNLDQFPDGPPNDDADYADFVATFVRRYRGKIHYIQIWNEPNLQGEWGGQPIDPARFTQLLKAAYLAAKQADPSIVVLMPGLAPTDQTGPTNLSDLLFLKGMYAAGAKDYFDIGVAMVYGYGYSPDDRRVDFARDNFSRVIQTREIMVRHGDADKPIWAAEYGWVSLPKDWNGNPSVWGQPVSRQTQADYLYEGYLRAKQEWPWMGVMCVWYFREPTSPTSTPDAAKNPTRGFAIVNYDFSPTPAFTLLAKAHTILDRAYTGAYTAASRWIQHDADWAITVAANGPRLIPTKPGATLSIPFSGPRLDLIFGGGSGKGFAVTIDGKPAPDLPKNSQGEAIVTHGPRVTVADGLSDGPHLAVLRALSGGENGSPSLAGFVVVRIPLSAWVYPWIYAALGLMLALTLASLGWNLLDRRRAHGKCSDADVSQASSAASAHKAADANVIID